jgi:molybdenum cofactor synthesis domain-containing protein
LRAAVITISTSKAAGAGEDESGPRLEQFARSLGAEQVARALIADDRAAIEGLLRRHADDERCALVLTTGGTGVSPDDVTPEATRAVLEREIAGIPEAIRIASRPHTKHWMLARPMAGVRGSTLIVNFPGSPAAIAQVAQALAPGLAHALALLAGHEGHHG